MSSDDIPSTKIYPVAKAQAPRFLRGDLAQTLSGGDFAATRALVQPVIAGALSGIAMALGTYVVTDHSFASIAAGTVTSVVFGVTTFIYTCENKPNYR